MSDLWAQVDLTLTGNFSTLTYLAPVDDMANVVETIAGQNYLLSLSTNINFLFNNGLATYGNGQGATAILSITNQIGQTNTSPIYYPWYPSISPTRVSGSYDVSALNDVPATMNNPGGFPNSIGAPFFYSAPAGTYAISTLLTISGVGQTIVVPNNISASSYITNFYAPTASASETWVAPPPDSQHGPYTEVATVYYPQYAWVDLGPAAANELLTIAPLDKAELGAVSLTADQFGKVNSQTQNGVIHFTDTDPTALPTGSIVSQTVTATNSVGSPIQLPANEISAMESAFSLSPESGNTNNGAIDWTFDPQTADLRFLPAGWNVTLTSQIQVADQNGNTDTATVSVTINSQLQYPSLVNWALNQTLNQTSGNIPLAIEAARAKILSSMRDLDSTNTAARDAEYYLIGLDAGYTFDPYGMALVSGTPVYNAWKSVANLLGAQTSIQADPGKLNSPPGGTSAAYQGLLDGLSAATKNAIINIYQINPLDPPNVSATIPAVYDLVTGQEDTINVFYSNSVPLDNVGRLVVDQDGAQLTLGDGNNFVIGGSGSGNITVGNGNNIVIGAPGSVLRAGSGSDLLIGGGNDTIYGGPGQDILIGGGGTDTLAGAPGGTTTAAYFGPRSEYQVATQLGSDGLLHTTVVDHGSAGDGTNFLTNVQYLQFADGTEQISAPTLAVTSISATTDSGPSVLDAGHVVTITVATSEAVTVTGTPTLQLNDNEVANYHSGSGTSTLTFIYTVQPGDNVADLQVSALNLPNGAAISDAAGNALSGSVQGDLKLQIDTDTGEQAALLLKVTDTLIGATGAGAVHFTVGGLESDDSGTVTFSDGTNQVPVPVSEAQTSYTANLSALADGPITSSLAVNPDPAGNSFTPVAGNTVTQDTDKAFVPMLQVDGGTSNIFVNASTAAAVPVTLTGLETGDTGTVTFTDSAGHTVPLSVSASQTTYTANLSSLADGTITTSLLVTDAANNTTTATGNPVTLDQDKVAEPPILKIGNSSLTVPAGGSVPVGITVSSVDGDDNVLVTISGVPQGFESVTANDGHAPVVHHGANYTFTAADVNNGLTLHSTYRGGGHPVNPLTVTASNTTTGETATSTPQIITVTDPPATTSAGEPSTGLPGIGLGQDPGHVGRLAALMAQFMAAGPHGDQVGAGSIAWNIGAVGTPDALPFLATPHYHAA